MQLTREELLKSYRTMRVIRDFEERVSEEFSGGAMPGFVHLYAGEEASAVGICQNLTDADTISSTHRGHGHCIAKGCDPRLMMLELYGRAEGLCGGKGGSMHIADLSKGMLGANGIVGGGPPLVCGAAFTAKYKKTGNVAVAFSGDGASNQGTTLESFNLAKVWNLPVLFVIEDNGYAEATSSEFAVAGDQLERAKGFDIPARRVDGHNFFEVNEAAREMIEAARNGGGPQLLHVKLDRFFGHFEGDAMTYRPEGEIQKIREEKDCLKNFRKHVVEAGLLTHEQLDEIDKEVMEMINASIKESETAAPPSADSLTTDVYVTY